MSDLVERLRSTRNWMKETGTNWKDAVCFYDRAPFEAADEIERLRAALRRYGQCDDACASTWQHENGCYMFDDARCDCGFRLSLTVAGSPDA